MSAPRVRLYGYGRTESSFVQVRRGMSRALAAAGELAGEFVLNETGLGEDDHDGDQGLDAPISLNTGNPQGLLAAHRAGQHQKHWLLLAPNSSGLPYGLLDGLVKPSAVLPKGLLTCGLLVPSAWARSIVRELTGLPVVVAPHGVTPEVHRPVAMLRAIVGQTYKQELFSVLHLTSSETERKGTRELLRAWGGLLRAKKIPARAELTILAGSQALSRLEFWRRDFDIPKENVALRMAWSFTPAELAAYYGTFHAVCQPSRGEGFGLVPLEALACGVPVAATACTGHSEYLGDNRLPPGAVLIEHGIDAPIDDYPGAYAPGVTVAAIAEGLELLYRSWAHFDALALAHSDRIRELWAWENVNAAPIQRMIELSL